MEIKKITQPYETLIRFKDGRPVGIHHTLETFYEEDGVINPESRKELPASGQDVEAFADSELMGQTATDALAEVTRVNEINQQLLTDMQTLRDQTAAEIQTIKEQADIAIRQAEQDCDAAVTEVNGKLEAMRNALAQAASVTASALELNPAKGE